MGYMILEPRGAAPELPHRVLVRLFAEPFVFLVEEISVLPRRRVMKDNGVNKMHVS
jgi:adenylate kinase